MSRIKIVFALLILSESLQAQTTLHKDSIGGITGEINRYLISAVEAYKFNGVALIAKEEKIILHKAYGWRNFETHSYNDTLTIFPILSITKSFTAMVILKLQEQKKLTVSDKLNKYLPGFPNGDKITIEHLITHRSGLHNFTDDIGEEDSSLVNHPVTKEFMLDFISKKPFDYSPGEGFGYNNSAFYLAGLLIEKVTGKSYEQNVKELIFEPLGMKHSGFDFNSLDENTKAKGYQFFTANQQKTYAFLDSTVSYSADLSTVQQRTCTNGDRQLGKNSCFHLNRGSMLLNLRVVIMVSAFALANILVEVILSILEVIPALYQSLFIILMKMLP